MAGGDSGNLVGLFTVGNFLYGRMGYAAGLMGVFVVAGLTLIWTIRRVWRSLGRWTIPEREEQRCRDRS